MSFLNHSFLEIRFFSDLYYELLFCFDFQKSIGTSYKFCVKRSYTYCKNSICKLPISNVGYEFTTKFIRKNNIKLIIGTNSFIIYRKNTYYR